MISLNQEYITQNQSRQLLLPFVPSPLTPSGALPSVGHLFSAPEGVCAEERVVNLFFWL